MNTNYRADVFSPLWVAALVLFANVALAQKVVDFGGDYVAADTPIVAGVNNFSGPFGTFESATTATFVNNAGGDRLSQTSDNGSFDNAYWWTPGGTFSFDSLGASDPLFAISNNSGRVRPLVLNDGTFYRSNQSKLNSGIKNFTKNDLDDPGDWIEFNPATLSDTGGPSVLLSDMDSVTAFGYIGGNGNNVQNGFEAFAQFTAPPAAVTLLDLDAVSPLASSEVQYGNLSDADLIAGGGNDARVMPWLSTLLDATDTDYNGPIDVYGAVTAVQLDGAGQPSFTDNQQKVTSSQLRWRGNSTNGQQDTLATAFAFDLSDNSVPYGDLLSMNYEASNELADDGRWLVELENGTWYITRDQFGSGEHLGATAIAELVWAEFDPASLNGTNDDIRLDPTGLTFMTMADMGLDALAVTRFGVHNQADFDINNRGLFLTDLELTAREDSLFAAVPEPASIGIWSLLGLALAGFGYYSRKISGAAKD